jgi:hypothetical protein
MEWTADVVSEPTREHELCLDLYEGSVHRARLQRKGDREFELVCYGGDFAIPAVWLANLINGFIEDIGRSGVRRGPT